MEVQNFKTYKYDLRVVLSKLNTLSQYLNKVTYYQLIGLYNIFIKNFKEYFSINKKDLQKFNDRLDELLNKNNIETVSLISEAEFNSYLKDF